MKYFFRFDEMKKFAFGPNVTSSFGSKIEGERMILGMADKKRGTGSKPHRHNVEQFNFVMKGTVRAVVGDEESIVGQGGVIYIPANTLHSIYAVDDEDVVFLTVKDKFEEIVVHVESD